MTETAKVGKKKKSRARKTGKKYWQGYISSNAVELHKSQGRFGMWKDIARDQDKTKSVSNAKSDTKVTT